MPGLPRSPLFGRRGARSAASSVAAEPQQPRVEIIEAPGLRWINIERPRTVDQAWLEERFEFHPLDYEDIFSRNQRPKVDEYDEYLFIRSEEHTSELQSRQYLVCRLLLE